MISGFCHEVAERCVLPGYYAGSTRCIITSKRAVHIMNSRLKTINIVYGKCLYKYM